MHPAPSKIQKCKNCTAPQPSKNGSGTSTRNGRKRKQHATGSSCRSTLPCWECWHSKCTTSSQLLSSPHHSLRRKAFSSHTLSGFLSSVHCPWCCFWVAS
eukprot:PhF_6_TR10259/c0_g1_i1/m.15906